MKNDLFHAQQQAGNCGLDISKLNALLQAIEQNLIQRCLSEKYHEMFYLAATGIYSAEDLAQIFKHGSKNLNADFNKNLGVYLKLYLELDDDERVGITSLRRILFKKGYFVDINDDNSVNVWARRYDENSQLEETSLAKAST
jgi:hypothetical protein